MSLGHHTSIIVLVQTIILWKNRKWKLLLCTLPSGPSPAPALAQPVTLPLISSLFLPHDGPAQLPWPSPRSLLLFPSLSLFLGQPGRAAQRDHEVQQTSGPPSLSPPSLSLTPGDPVIIPFFPNASTAHCADVAAAADALYASHRHR